MEFCSGRCAADESSVSEKNGSARKTDAGRTEDRTQGNMWWHGGEQLRGLAAWAVCLGEVRVIVGEEGGGEENANGRLLVCHRRWLAWDMAYIHTYCS